MKASDTLPAKISGSNDANIKIGSLWHITNFCYTVTCQNAMRRRYMFSWKLLNESLNSLFHDLKSVMEDPLYNY